MTVHFGDENDVMSFHKMSHVQRELATHETDILAGQTSSGYEKKLQVLIIGCLCPFMFLSNIL